MNLKMAREISGFSLRDAGKYVGCSQTLIAKIESGKVWNGVATDAPQYERLVELYTPQLNARIDWLRGEIERIERVRNNLQQTGCLLYGDSD